MTSSVAPRTDEHWDITTGVGLTALAAASCRERESARPDALVRDPYAGAFLTASGTVLPGREDPTAQVIFNASSTYLGVRSRYFDDVLTAAAASGITQVVLLAAGLDVRAHRLDWPPSTTVFELDVPAVLAFKERVLDERGARPLARRVPVAADLRDDWPAALRSAGHDPSRPTAWLAEGLLAYLPPDAERLLFERVHALSAPGSRFSAEDLSPASAVLGANPALRERFATMLGRDLLELFQGAQHDRAASRFATHGWSISPVRVGSLAERYGRRIHESVADVFCSVEVFQAGLAGAG